MHRITSESYSGSASAPAVTYCYDGLVAASGGGGCAASASIPNALTHLTQAYSSASATTHTAFDAVGRITSSSQQTPGGAGGTLYPFGTAANPGYSYNLAGEMLSETYPSGRKVTFSYDAAGRTKDVTNPATNVNYADLSLFSPSSSQYAYAPNGAMQYMTLGNNVVETWNWDPIRLQPQQTQIGSLLTLNYYYCPSSGTSCASNNGNMLSQTISTPTLGTVTQNFTYADGFNRLNTAQELNGSNQTNWSQGYSYDNYGNQAVTSGYIEYPGQTPTALSQFNAANRWSGSGYDNGGNMMSAPNQGFTYDAENRQVASTEPGTPAISYVYDGDGNRVQKTVGTAATAYVYDANGELTAEYGAQTDVGTSYVSVDQVGSTRLLQRGLGTVAHYDYLPFGEDIPAGQFGRDSSYASGTYPANGPDYLSFKFTGKERDWESGLDFFQARYYSPWQGRFGGADPENAGADNSTPQTWHGYGYVTNSPLVNTDPDGLEQILSPWLPGSLGANAAAAEQAYAQGVDALFFGNLAYKYASSGDIIGAQHIAGLSGGAIQISDISTTIFDQTSHSLSIYLG